VAHPVIIPKLYKIYTLEIYNPVVAPDRAYYRQSREARFGAALEEFTAGREALLPVVREALAPLRAQLVRSPFLGGDTPAYVEYVVLGTFQCVTCISAPLLARDVPSVPGSTGSTSTEASDATRMKPCSSSKPIPAVWNKMRGQKGESYPSMTCISAPRWRRSRHGR
jgi:hypothetical protein